MSATKSELKAAAASEIGAAIEDAKEAALADVHRGEGAIVALAQAERLIAQLGAVLETEHAAEDQTLAKRFLDRAVNAVRGLSGQAENQRLIASGKVLAHDAGVRIIAKYRDTELAKGKNRGKDT